MPTTKVESIKKSIMNKIQKAEDVVFKENFTKEKYLETYYIKSISDEQVLGKYVLKPFFEIQGAELFLDYLQSHPKISTFKTEAQTVESLLRGEAVLFYQDYIFLFDCKVDRNNAVQDTTVETTIQGPQSGFSESLHKSGTDPASLSRSNTES